MTMTDAEKQKLIDEYQKYNRRQVNDGGLTIRCPRFSINHDEDLDSRLSDSKNNK